MRTAAEQSAECAFRAILAYGSYSGASDKSVEAREGLARDFLAGLRHLADESGWDFAELDREAQERYAKGEAG